MDGEWIGIILLICLGGCIALGVASALGGLLAKRRREQFSDGWDDEWTE